ncbi:MAG: hypothetical protein DRJ42_29195, partial [Deltaproteobacteria bacterium]
MTFIIIKSLGVLGLVLFTSWDATAYQPLTAAGNSGDPGSNGGPRLGFGAASVAHEDRLGWLDLTFAAEAEWELHDDTLVPLDVMAGKNLDVSDWLTAYVGVAACLVVERTGSAIGEDETAIYIGAAARVGAAFTIIGWL